MIIINTNLSLVQPPLHIPIVFGPVKSKKVSNKKKKSEEALAERDENKSCSICHSAVSSSESLSCLYPSCSACFHILCLSDHFTDAALRTSRTEAGVLPVGGDCPACHGELLWGNLIRKKRGCYDDLEELDEEDCDNYEDED